MMNFLFSARLGAVSSAVTAWSALRTPLVLLALLLVSGQVSADNQVAPAIATHYKITAADGSPLNGITQTPGAPSSFSIAQGLSTGFRIYVGPSKFYNRTFTDLPDRNNILYAYIYEDWQQADVIPLDKSFAAMNLNAVGGPQPYNPGSYVTVNYPFQPGKHYTVALAIDTTDRSATIAPFFSLHWCSEAQCINENVTNQEFSRALTLNPTEVRASTFYYGTIAVDLAWEDTVPGQYQPYSGSPGSIFPSRTIAANYGTPVKLITQQPAGSPPLAYATMRVYIDNWANPTVLDPGDGLLQAPTTLTVPGNADVFWMPLPDLTETGPRNPSLFFWIDVELTNIYGHSIKLSDTAGGPIPIGSYRALAIPQECNWSIALTGNTCILPFTTNADTRNERDINYQLPVPGSCNEGGQDVMVTLSAYRDWTGYQQPVSENWDMTFDTAMLSGYSGSCENPSRNTIVTPTSVTTDLTGAHYLYPEWERYQTERRRWAMDNENTNYPAGTYVEAALLRMTDARSGKSIGVDPAQFTSGDWVSETPVHTIRLHKSYQTDCSASVAVDFLDESATQNITLVRYNGVEPVSFNHRYTYDPYPEVTPNKYIWEVKRLDGSTIPYTDIQIIEDVLGTGAPISGVPYHISFRLAAHAGITEDFDMIFKALLDTGSSTTTRVLASKTMRVLYDPVTAGPTPVVTQMVTSGMYIPQDLITQMNVALTHTSTLPTSSVPSTVSWRWRRSDGNFLLPDGSWVAPGGAGDAYRAVPTTPQTAPTAFSDHWTATPGTVATTLAWNGSHSFAAFADNFFGAFNDTVTVNLDLRMTWPNNQVTDYTSPSFPVTRYLETGSLNSVAVRLSGSSTTYPALNLLAEQMSRLQFVVNATNISGSALRIVYEGVQYTPDQVEADQDTFILGIAAGSPLVTALATQGEKAVSVTDGQGGTRGVTLYVREARNNITIRYHFRDQLGSSAVTQTFRTLPTAPDAAPQDTSLTTEDDKVVLLFNHGPTATYYSPFGDPLESDTDPDVAPRYTDHEFDRTTGLTYMKARYQLPNLAVFNRPDPRRDWDWEKPNSLNLFQYASNNPINRFDPDGLTDYTFWIRSFAPFKTFGGGFHGDDRGFSSKVDSSTTSRVNQKFVFDGVTGRTSDPKYWSGESGHFLLGKKTGKPTGTLSQGRMVGSPGESWAGAYWVSGSYLGINPLTPPALTPGISLAYDLIIHEDKTKGVLTIKTEMKGDAFPSAEAIVEDPLGTTVIFGASVARENSGLAPTSMGPLTSLKGFSARPMMDHTVHIHLDKDGNFSGNVTFQGKTYTIEEWNKQFEGKKLTTIILDKKQQKDK